MSLLLTNINCHYMTMLISILIILLDVIKMGGGVGGRDS